MSKKCSAGRWC